jgi:hypothetical protein
MSKYDKLCGGYVKRIHMDRHKIRRGEPDAVTVQTSAGSIKCRSADILGESSVVYRPDKPLSCGAKAWVETKARVEVFV